MDGQQYDPASGFKNFTSAWVRSQKHLSNSVKHFYSGVAEANRAFFATQNGHEEASAVEATAPEESDAAEATRLEGTDELAYREEDWTVERSVDAYENLQVGDFVRFTKRLTDDDVRSFANISGDTNRLHLDDEFAERTRFGHRIVHGTLVSGLISAALARFPGLTIYLSQDVKFKRPVDIGQEVTAVCEIVEDLGEKRYRLTTEVENDEGTVVIDGEAVVIIDALPDED